MTGPTRRWLYRRVRATLRREYRRLVWVGEWAPPPSEPVILYANHHVFWDGHILGYLVERVLGRRTVIWMEQADRFPFFKLGGVMSFPSDDPARRAGTVRRTVRLMARDPLTTLIYFPEGSLRAAVHGVQIPSDDRCRRVARTLPRALWWPVSLRASGPETHRPTVWITSGQPHLRPDGREAQRLERLLAQPVPAGHKPRVILEGTTAPGERWDFTRFPPFARRDKR